MKQPQRSIVLGLLGGSQGNWRFTIYAPERLLDDVIRICEANDFTAELAMANNTLAVSVFSSGNDIAYRRERLDRAMYNLKPPTVLTAKDLWEGALGSTAPASEDANAYPRPVQAPALTAADLWELWASAPEEPLPTPKQFTVVKLPAKELKVGDEIVGTYNRDWTPEESWRVIGVQKSRNPAEIFIRWTRVVPTPRGDWFNTRTEAMWLTDWYKVKRSA